MYQPIRLGAEHNDGERQIPRFVLVWKVFVHGHENIKSARVGDKTEKFAVADAGPTDLGNGFDSVAGKFVSQILRQTLVEEQAHSSGGDQTFAGLFEKGHSLLARDGRELFRKLV